MKTPITPLRRHARVLLRPLSLAPLLVALASAGCDRGSPDVDTGGVGAAPKMLVAYPATEAQDIPLDASLHFRFDRYLDPTSVSRQAVRITGGTLDPETGDPLAGFNFVQPVYDPAERVVTFRTAEVTNAQGSSARFTWAPSTRYTITFFKASENSGFGLRGYNGKELAETITLNFTTAAQNPATPEVNPVGGQAISYCSQCVGGKRQRGAREILQGSCAMGGCHGASEPAAGLDLSSASAIATTALNQLAHGSLNSSGSTPVTGSSLFGRSMPLVDPGDPGNSYLLYKVLVDPKTAAETSPYNSAPFGLGPAPGDDGERASLRNNVVVGDSMPLGGHLSAADVQVLQQWIRQGAPLSKDENCPKVIDCGSPSNLSDKGALMLVVAGPPEAPSLLAICFASASRAVRLKFQQQKSKKPRSFDRLERIVA